jgi:F0F1-type ATP synthase epsilon subunit
MSLNDNMLTCTIISPQKSKVYKNVPSIAVPASWGQAQILPGHAEAFLLLNKGTVILSRAEQETIQISSGECYVKDNSVKIVL